MWVSPAPALANIYAFWYEYSFLRRTGEKYVNTAHTDECLQYSTLEHYVRYTKRFIDDILYIVDPNSRDGQQFSELLTDKRASGGTDEISSQKLVTDEGVTIDNPIAFEIVKPEKEGTEATFLDIGIKGHVNSTTNVTIYGKRDGMDQLKNYLKFPHIETIVSQK